MQKFFKRFMAIVLTLVMTITAIPLTGIEAKAAEEYKYGNYYYYPQDTQFISSIRYGQESKHVDAVAEATLDNHTCVEVDLNSGISGSDYIYLGYKTSTNINDAVATYFTAAHTNLDSSAQITINDKSYSFTATALDTSGMQDLNADAGGDYIYLYASKDAALGLPVTAISASASSDSATQPPSGFVTVKKTNESANETTEASECNSGSSGDYIYMYYDNTSAYTNVTEEILALKEKIEVAENLNQSDYTAESWAKYSTAPLATARSYIAVYESNRWKAGYVTPQELKNAKNDLDAALNVLESKTFNRTVSTKGQWNLIMSEAAKKSETWNITLGSDILISSSTNGKLSAVPSGTTINLNMNGYNIEWNNIGSGNDDIISTSYPFADTYWGMITNNGTLNIVGKGTISSYHIRSNYKNSTDKDNYGAKSAAIVNNGTLNIGSLITIKNYIGIECLSKSTLFTSKYMDLFIYSHGIYNSGTVYSSGNIYSGAFAAVPAGSNTNSYVCSYSYGIFGGTVNSSGGHIFSEAKSGFSNENALLIKKANRSSNIAVGIYSNNAELKGDTSITTKATSWRDYDGSTNIWKDGLNMSWGIGIMYSKNNYPYIGSAVNIDSSFEYIANETTVNFPEYSNPIFSFTVSSNNGPETVDRRAYAVAGISKDLNSAMYGGQTGETTPWSGDVFGQSTSTPFTTTDFRSEYHSGGLITSSDNYIQTGSNTHETLTSRIENGFPAGNGNITSENNSYSAAAAVEYARRYALSYNTEWYFYSSGGDCANFVSQSLFAGGYQFDDTWFNYDSSSAANYCSHPRYTWIRAHELRDYLVANGGIMIHNPKPSDFSLGDAVFYDWEQNGRIDHSAIVTAIDNGIPKVSYHSADGSTRLDEYWTMGKSEACCYLIKLNGNTCSNNNAQSYTHYRIKNSVKAKDIKIMSQPGSGTVLGTGDGYNIRYNSGIRVFREQNGWGYFNYYGTWGWIDLSLCTKIGTWNKIEVGHSMSGWYTYILPTCKTPGVKLNECTKCDYFEKQEISKISHTYKAATCTSARYCTMCGATEGSALGHNWSSTVINPTCVSEGKKVSSCTRCNITKTETISKVDHSWSNYTTTKQPTCTQNGIETSICSVCSTKRTRSTAALGHNMEEITVSASCLTEGTTTSRCTRCSYTKHSDSSAALGHDYQTTVTIANCTENGCTTYVCSRCNDTYTDSSSEWSAWTETYDTTAPEGKIKEENGLYSYIQIAWGHNFSVTDSAQATCTENGHTTQTCSRCQLEETENIDALGHIWGEWTDNKNGSHSRICGRDASHIETADHIWYNGTMTVAPTCETAGTMEYTCEICSGTSTETIDPIGHDYYLDEDMSVAPTCAEDGYDYHTCANNPAHYYKEVLTATGHNMSEQTDYPPETGCGEGKKVSECTKDDCDYFEEEYYFIEHSYGDEIYVPGNCGFESYSYIECEKCSSSLIFIGEIDPNNHANYETEIIDAVDPTCEEDGYTGDTICMQCSGIKEAGQIIPATGHDWNDWETITAATCETDGLKKRVCKNDENHIEENVLTAIGHKWDDGVIDPDSTCKVHGTKTYTCQNDASHIKTEEVALDENNHVGDTYIKDNKDATCTEDGYTGDTYCSDCDKNLANGAVIPALKHDMGEWYTVTAATCTTNGLEKSDCSRCDYSEERKTSIDSDNHYPETFYTVDIKADCENSGKKSHHCERCDTPLDNITIPAKGHSYDNGATTTAPTCTTDGVKTFTCQNDTTDEYSACAHSYTEAIPATGHNWGEWTTVSPETCETDGLEKRVCKNDASHIEENVLTAIGHNYVGDTTSPDCTEQGYTTYTCSVCSDTYVDDYIDAHGHNYNLIPEKSKAPDYGVAGFNYYECSYDASHNYTEALAPLVKTTFTATFVVTAPFFNENKTVGTVTFEKGDKYVEEPSVESYKNYTFAWDEYELKDEDITIYGRYTEIEIDDVSDVETNIEATYNNGIATIVLEAKSPTKNIKVLSENTKPVDVVLVLDQSGSMAETLGGTKITKQKALINCANSFVNELYENAVATGADHRVALVGFAYSNYNSGNYQNTGILATTSGKAYGYSSLKSDKSTNDTAYKTALIPVVDNNGINSYITNGINKVAASGATAADLGLEIANDIFSVTKNDGTRERIVIFITDGTPTSYGETTNLVEDTSAAAIKQANDLKKKQGAKIYSVGVHSNADPSAEFTIVNSGVTTDNKGNFKSFDFNRFLHAVSSNYPAAGSMKISDLGEGSKDNGYYMGVNDTSNLSKIFSKILYSSVYEINTFDKVTLVNTISKEFTLTLEQEKEMRENLTSTFGIKNEDISVIRNEDGTTTVKFANVRATKVYNADGSSYYSATVSFNVFANEETLVGGKFETNTGDSYAEMGGVNIGSFVIPTVNVEQNRNIVVFTINGVVYRIDEVNLGDNVIAPESDLAKWNISEGTLVTENCAYFEASEVSDAKYTITWISEGKQEVHVYAYGSTIIAPEASEKEGYNFVKWSSAVPVTMPANDMTFIAVYAEKHDHEFNVDRKYGDCESGIVTVSVCACGETKETISDPVPHTGEAVVSKTNNGTLIERINCTECGKYVEQNLTYKVSYSQGWKTTVLDLTLYENEVAVQPDGTMKIMFQVGDYADKNYTVYRIDENGTTTKYTPEKQNGFLIFDVDHFSIYVITEIDESTQEPVKDIDYDEAICILNGHNYTSSVKEATCITNGYTIYTCTDCYESYRTDEVDATGHKDENSDDICDICGDSLKVSEPETPTTTCSHHCHKSGFMNFLWKIARFFYKLFNMEAYHYCDCGAAHW